MVNDAKIIGIAVAMYLLTVKKAFYLTPYARIPAGIAIFYFLTIILILVKDVSFWASTLFLILMAMSGILSGLASRKFNITALEKDSDEFITGAWKWLKSKDFAILKESKTFNDFVDKSPGSAFYTQTKMLKSQTLGLLVMLLCSTITLVMFELYVTVPFDAALHIFIFVVILFVANEFRNITLFYAMRQKLIKDGFNEFSLDLKDLLSDANDQSLAHELYDKYVEISKTS